jgi:NitT/TauT family transport system ATP-binding protein
MDISIDRLGKRFDTRSGDTIVALDGVTTSVRSGEFVALLGPSGCGKSTLLDIVAGLQAPTSGALTLGDGATPERPGFVFQAPTLLPWRTALENVCLPAEVGAKRAAGRTERAERLAQAQALLTLVGLAGFEHKLPAELSGGMQQRVALARALLLNSTVLCMDEPFSALDEFTREQMHLELLRIWQERRFTTLFVTHNVFEAAFLADRVLVMTPRPGKVVADVRVRLPRPRTRDMIGSEEFAADIREIRASMLTYWTQEAEANVA